MDAKLAQDERKLSGRQSRVVLAPEAGAKFSRSGLLRDDGGKRARLTGEQLCFRRPVFGRAQGWRCAPPPPAADGLDPVRPPVFRLGMRSAEAERDRSLCDG